MDQLAANYASQPVRVLESPYYDPFYSGPPPTPSVPRASRFWAAWPGTSGYFPMTMTDCGQEYSDGSNIAYAKYQAMVDAALARAPLGRLSVSRERVDDTLEFGIAVRNQTGETLSTSNGATVWALVYEEPPSSPSADTDRRIVNWQWASVTPALADGQWTSFDLVVDLSGVTVNWSNVKSVVFVDFLPSGGGGVYDMVQAAFQD